MVVNHLLRKLQLASDKTNLRNQYRQENRLKLRGFSLVKESRSGTAIMALRAPPVLRVRRALYAADAACPFAARTQQLRTIRTIRKKVPPVSRFNTAFMPMRASPAAALARKEASDTLPLRSGALATKKGMSAMYDPETGKRTPCTVLQLDRVQVIGNKTRAKNGYFAVCVGHSWRTPQRVGNAMLGVFAKAQYENEAGGMVGISPKKDVREFRVRDASGLLKIGDIISPSWFQEGQFIDARATSKGHGFTGVSLAAEITSVHINPS